MTIEFSILIPTRDRPDTLRHTLQTVVTQPGDDYEVVIADNCSRPEVRQIVDEATRAGARIKYLRSDHILPMSDNWERGLSACEGRYITVLGDDDGFMPSTLMRVRNILGQCKTKLLAWHPQVYWWPDTIISWKTNRLDYWFSPGTWTVVDSAAILRKFFSHELAFDALPMIYNAFFHCDLVTDIKKRRGAFFWPLNMPADIVSGIGALLATESFAASAQRLTVRGNSKASTGTAHWARSLGAERRAAYLAEEQRTLDQICHSSLIPSPNLHVLIASTKLRMQEALFPERTDIVFDPACLVRTMLGALNSEPEAYDANLADVRALAEKIGFTLRPGMIPPRQKLDRQPFQGVFGNGTVAEGVSINCDTLGISNVAQAARLADSFTL